MQKTEAVEEFSAEVLPGVLAQFGPTDRTAVRTAWNDWTDSLQKSGRITARQSPDLDSAQFHAHGPRRGPMTLPYVTAPALNPEAVASAARYVLREYGDTGYTMAVEAGGFGAVVFRCRASDGSEFRVYGDRYGEARTLPELDDLAEAMAADREAQSVTPHPVDVAR